VLLAALPTLWPFVGPLVSEPVSLHLWFAVALAALGLLLLAVRVASLYQWLGLPVPAVFVDSALGQTAALTLLVVVLAVVARRDLAAR
jgi:hypothetical protein